MEAILPADFSQWAVSCSMNPLPLFGSVSHKAVDEGILDAVFLGNIAEFEQMVKRAVHATVAGQSHKVDILAVFLCI